MTSCNLSRARQYLQAVESGESFETVAGFYAPDVVIQEFPNRISPQGRVRRAHEARMAFDLGRQILQTQSYKVRRMLEAGDEVAIELEWSGTLAVPVMNLPAASEMKAFVAIFLTFRDGKIVSQRSYDCYPPFGEPSENQRSPAPAAPA
jgi:ketosteroid isomerase-like protein